MGEFKWVWFKLRAFAFIIRQMILWANFWYSYSIPDARVWSDFRSKLANTSKRHRCSNARTSADAMYLARLIDPFNTVITFPAVEPLNLGAAAHIVWFNFKNCRRCDVMCSRLADAATRKPINPIGNVNLIWNEMCQVIEPAPIVLRAHNNLKLFEYIYIYGHINLGAIISLNDLNWESSYWSCKNLWPHNVSAHWRIDAKYFNFRERPFELVKCFTQSLTSLPHNYNV